MNQHHLLLLPYNSIIIVHDLVNNDEKGTINDGYIEESITPMIWLISLGEPPRREANISDGSSSYWQYGTERSRNKLTSISFKDCRTLFSIPDMTSGCKSLVLDKISSLFWGLI